MAQREAGHREAMVAKDSRLAELAAQADELERRLQGMEASRFWKAREVWWRLRRRMRVG
jgi:hypothetical protein